MKHLSALKCLSTSVGGRDSLELTNKGEERQLPIRVNCFVSYDLQDLGRRRDQSASSEQIFYWHIQSVKRTLQILQKVFRLKNHLKITTP